MTSPRRNIELKVRYADLGRAREAVGKLSARFECAMEQMDTYFCTPRGRLKLREIKNGEERSAELISYERADSAEFRGSNYYVVPVAEAELLKAALSASCGLRGVVRKCREVYLFHNVRIHLDRVEGLGSFIEFEAVMTEGDSEADSLARLEQIHVALGIRSEDHECGSYCDLLGI